MSQVIRRPRACRVPQSEPSGDNPRRLPDEIAPEDLPHVFVYSGNGRRYRIQGTKQGNVYVVGADD